MPFDNWEPIIGLRVYIHVLARSVCCPRKSFEIWVWRLKISSVHLIVLFHCIFFSIWCHIYPIRRYNGWRFHRHVRINNWIINMLEREHEESSGMKASVCLKVQTKLKLLWKKKGSIFTQLEFMSSQSWIVLNCSVLSWWVAVKCKLLY